ncbi:MAG TPA: hypothetical protein VFT04_04925 [Gemmatimonadales bacterium]|nr:hypothetical protein [Gemmatimonadales bacterium]
MAQLPSRDWSLEDRVVIGDFSHITSVAAAFDRVYATSPTALLIWRPQFARWEGPYQPPDPRYLRGVFAALADPLDNSLWLARPDGWVHFAPELQMWSGGEAPAAVRGIAFDLSDPSGLLLETAQGWLRATRGSGAVFPAERPAQAVRPATLADVARTNPSMQTGGGVLVDNRLSPVRYTAAAQSFDRLGWYLATDGAGLLYLREGSAFPERLAFGIAGERVGALFAAPGGVWVASEATRDVPAAITFVASDLSDFRSIYGPPATGLPFGRVRQMIGVGLSLWAATDFGVARIDPQNSRIDLIDERRGLPDSRAYAVVARRGWIAAGTARGAARIADSSDVIRVAPGFSGPAYAVAMSADTTWVGTDAGLFYTVGRDGELLQPRGLAGSVQFRGPVIGLEWEGELLVALTPDRMFWRSSSGRWIAGPEQPALGPLRSFVMNDGGAWIAGERGVGFARLDAPVGSIVLPGDLPGEPVDLAVDADHLWVGTLAGLVRFRLAALR